MKRTILLILSVTTMAATPQRAPDIQRSSETIDVSIVNVDAFVTDRAGNRVHGLTRDDFEVFEDGKFQPITNLTEYASDVENEKISVSGGEPAASRGAAILPPRKQRTIVVFVDEGVGGKEIAGQLKELLHRAIRPGDAVTILAWGAKAYVRQQFTDDLQKVDRMLDSMSGPPRPEFSDQEQIERERQWMAGIARRHPGLSVDDDFPSGGGATAAMRAKTHAISAVLQSLSGVDGQKIMLFITPRFSMFAYREVNRRTFPELPTFRERVLYSTGQFVESVAQAANAAGVTIYPLHPPGLGNDWNNASEYTVPKAGDPTRAGFDHLQLDNEVQALRLVADQTGGQTAWGKVDVVNLIPRIERDLTDYYSLGYRSSADGSTGDRQDRARKIVVKTKNRDYSVRSRSQVIEKSDNTKMKDRVVSALFQQTDGASIPIRLRLGQRAIKGNRFIEPLSIEIPVKSLLPDGNTSRGVFSVYVALGDSVSLVGDVTQRTQPFAIGDMQKAKDGLFRYEFDLLTDGKIDRIAVGVFDEVTKEYGLQRIDLQIPGSH
jgi:VWFA-related protein